MAASDWESAKICTASTRAFSHLLSIWQSNDSQWMKREPVLETEVPAAGPAVRMKQINHVKDTTTSPLSTTKTSYLFTSRPHIHAHTYVQYWYEDWPQTYLNFIFINTAMLWYASDPRELCKKAWHRAVVSRMICIRTPLRIVEHFPQDYNLFLLTINIWE